MIGHSLGGILIKQVRRLISHSNSCCIWSTPYTSLKPSHYSIGSCQCSQQPKVQPHTVINVSPSLCGIYYEISAKIARRGLAFFGTPHGGGKETLVSLGSACARIVTAVSTNPSNDIMEVLRSGSLFSDILQESWRHQLSSYKIVSFYEGSGEVSN